MQGAIAVVMMEAQSEHLGSIDWQRGKWAYARGKYSREHTWWLVGGAKFKASAAELLDGELGFELAHQRLQRGDILRQGSQLPMLLNVFDIMCACSWMLQTHKHFISCDKFPFFIFTTLLISADTNRGDS